MVNEIHNFSKESDWRPYFPKNTELKLKYYKLDDDTEILTVKSVPNKISKRIRPVILIPGWISTILGWKDVVRPIAEVTTVIYIESREKNSSKLIKNNKTKMGVERMAEDIFSIRNDLGIDISESICLSSSLGGSIMMSYLSRNIDTPKVSVFIGPIMKFNFPPIIGRIVIASPIFMVRILKRYVKWHLLKFKVNSKEEPEQAKKYEFVIDNADTWKLRQSGRELTKFNGWKILDKIMSDVILVGASKDKLHSTEETIKITKLIKNAMYIDFKSNKNTHSEEMGRFIVRIASDNYASELIIL